MSGRWDPIVNRPDIAEQHRRLAERERVDMRGIKRGCSCDSDGAPCRHCVAVTTYPAWMGGPWKAAALAREHRARERARTG